MNADGRKNESRRASERDEIENCHCTGEQCPGEDHRRWLLGGAEQVDQKTIHSEQTENCQQERHEATKR